MDDGGVFLQQDPGKLTSQLKNNQLKMYLLLKTVVFHCHVSLLEGRVTVLGTLFVRVSTLFRNVFIVDFSCSWGGLMNAWSISICLPLFFMSFPAKHHLGRNKKIQKNKFQWQKKGRQHLIFLNLIPR